MSMRSDKEQNLRAWRDHAAVLQGIVDDTPLEQILDKIALAAESEADELSCEILVIDSARGIITQSAGPSLPEIIRPGIGAKIQESAGQSMCFSGTQG